ncbi:MAG: hypothetical protein H7289_08050 [Mucilaginibacter sp.]|nr:hypothetical protein [Mucilaginibacter sp.]
MTAIEHKELKGITIRNIMVTLFGTASIVISVTTSYVQLKSDINEIRTAQDSQSRLNELRLKVLEGNVAVLQQEVREINENNKIKP